MCLATGMISRGRIQQLLALPTSPTHLFLAEIYSSLQGEGLLTGTPSVFIRTSGCNLRCWFCDTPYTSWQPEGEDLSVNEILRRATDSQIPTSDLRPPASAPGASLRSSPGHPAARHAV